MNRIGVSASLLVGLLFMTGWEEPAFAEESATKPGVMERIEATAKKVGKKLEEAVTKTAKKVEEKHIGDKIGQKLKKAADKTAEGFEKAGNKIEQKLGN
jgi:predicted outer membrane protein